MRAASRWMRNAAGEKDFASQASAQVYAGIADFENAIVPRIAEGTDAGLYGPYFSELSELIASLETEGTDVMRLQGADLALDALRVYPRKFRADGVAKEEMDALAERAAALAKSVDTTSQTADEQKARILGNLEATKQAISDSFVDVGVRTNDWWNIDGNAFRDDLGCRLRTCGGTCTLCRRDVLCA